MRLHGNLLQTKLFGRQFCRCVGSLAGFADAAVGMRDGVLDDADAGSRCSGRGVIELKDGGTRREDAGRAW